MQEIEKIVKQISEKLNTPIAFYPENGKRADVPFAISSSRALPTMVAIPFSAFLLRVLDISAS